MGKVIRKIEFDKNEELIGYLNTRYKLSLNISEKENCDYPNQELDSVLVNLNVSKEKDSIILTISKLVSLKAFLLGKEEGMDVVKLIQTIDKVMNMSSEGIQSNEKGIMYDKNLKEFLLKASMQIESIEDSKVILSDNKRKVSIKYSEEHLVNTLDFNTIEEI